MKKITLILIPIVLFGCERKNEVTDNMLVGLWQCTAINAQISDYDESRNQWETYQQQPVNNKPRFMSFKLANGKLMMAVHSNTNKPLGEGDLNYGEFRLDIQIIQGGEGHVVKTHYEYLSDDKYTFSSERITYDARGSSWKPIYKKQDTTECFRLTN